MEYKICSRCIIDTPTYPDIVFDENGVCNVCHTYDQMAEKFRIEQDVLGENYLFQKIARIKEEGKNKE